MKRTLSIVAAALLLACCAPKPRLVIIHDNDTHSHFEAMRSGPAKGRGGLMERAAFIDSVRKAEGASRVLLLHGGDFSQGTPYFTQFRGKVEDNVVNALGYDAVTLGNHEFDNGLEDLAWRLKEIGCPVVCANVDFNGTEVEGMVKPYVILERAGMKIGIIGLTADLASSVTSAVSSRITQPDDAEAVNRWLPEVREKSDMVILLSHRGFQEDCALVPKTSGLDLVIGAHSHVDMDEMRDLVDADGNVVPMITDGSWALNMGLLKVW